MRPGPSGRPRAGRTCPAAPEASRLPSACPAHRGSQTARPSAGAANPARLALHAPPDCKPVRIERVAKLFLLGYFGAGNFGDDALLADWLRRHSQWLDANGVMCDVLSRSPRPLS